MKISLAKHFFIVTYTELIHNCSEFGEAISFRS